MSKYIPMVVTQEGKNERSYDIFSRLLNDRIILINGPINDDVAAVVTAELLFLASEDPKKDIQLYITSPGGSVMAGLAIYDTMKHIPCDVSTICLGYAASMGAFLLAGGTKGKRSILPNAEVMIHQPSGGAKGTASDIVINAEHIVNLRKKLNKLMAGFTGKSVKKIEKDVDRDYWMTAEEALKYGMVDKILQKEESDING
ncbi:MAG: ATP-dependent Clp protease proteolytic subunit [archaeon]